MLLPAKPNGFVERTIAVARTVARVDLGLSWRCLNCPAGWLCSIVVTGSYVAVGYGHRPVDREFTEDDWTNLDRPNVNAYVKSKLLAERAAWDFINAETTHTELTVINPGGIFGPILGKDLSTSIKLIQALITHGPDAVANVAIPVVDIRDVADLHVTAMTHPGAPGERFIACCDNSLVTMRDVARILRAWTGVDANGDPPVVGDIRRPSNRKAKTALGWTPRSVDEAVTTTARSLANNGLAPGPR
jgi:dihydroflavonol-4-reductase